MGLIAAPVFSDLDTKKYLATYPANPLRVHAADTLVKYFPRRYFTWRSPSVQDKIISHTLVFRKNLTTLRNITNDQEYDLGVADEAQVLKLAEHKEAFPLHTYLNRLKAGDECFYLAIGGEIKAYQWVSYRQCKIYCGFDSEFGFLDLKQDESYTYDFYTYRSSRGKGYGQALKRYTWQELAHHQKNLLYCAIHHENFISLRIHLKSAFRLQGLSYLYRLMALTRVIHGTQEEVARVARWLDSLGLTEP